MATIRVARRARYTSIDRKTVNDERLSFRARGVLSWLLDKPDDWSIDSSAISNHGPEGRDAVRTALRELVTFGYLHRERVQLDDGTWTSISTLYERPPPKTENQSSDSQPPKTDIQASVDRASVDQQSDSQASSTEDCDRTLRPPPSPPGPGVALELVTPEVVALRAPDAVAQVFAAWIESTGKNGRTVLSDKRRKLIRKALELYPVQDVVDACCGWRRSPHHRGENDRRTVYNDIELLLRDSEHIERFRDLERGAGPAPVAAVPDSWQHIDEAFGGAR